MRRPLVFLFLGVTLVYAGVAHFSPEEEHKKWHQYHSLCTPDQTGDYGQDVNGNRVFCKRAPYQIRQESSHVVAKDLGIGGQQVVFVESPPLELNHKVLVRAQFEERRTKVYVVPNKVDNRYEVDVREEGGHTEKPQVFYLKRGPSPGHPTPTKETTPSLPPPPERDYPPIFRKDVENRRPDGGWRNRQPLIYWPPKVEQPVSPSDYQVPEHPDFELPVPPHYY